MTDVFFTILYAVGFISLLVDYETNNNKSFCTFTYKTVLLYMVYLILVLK